MNLIGLDTGTTSGCCILAGDQYVHAEAFRPKGETDSAIFAGFRIWWRAMLVSHEIQEIALEEPLRTDLLKTEVVPGRGDAFGATTNKIKKPIGNMRTFLRLYGIRAHAIEVAESLNIPFREVNNKTWRSKVYAGQQPPKGTKNTSEWWKATALARCKVLGWPIKSKDAAEGAMIAEYLRIALKEERLGISQRPADLFSGEAA